MIYIYTDGSCNNKTHDKGGIGIVLIDSSLKERNDEPIMMGSWYNTTSARMEIRAVLEALKLVEDKTKPVTIYCDNQYVVNSIDKRWAYRWKEEGWGTRLNQDLWKQVLIEIDKFLPGNVHFHWIRGHNGNIYNETCDQLANRGGNHPNLIEDIRG